MESAVHKQCIPRNKHSPSRDDSMIVFFTNLNHKFFVLINLLYSSTCFEHYYAHLQEDNCISTASGTVTIFR